MAINSIILTGNLTKEVELQKTGDTEFAKFTVAVNRSYTDKCDFINCVVFGKRANAIVNYTKKGDMLGVEGRLEINKIDDKFFYSVVVNNIHFLEKKSNKENGSI